MSLTAKARATLLGALLLCALFAAGPVVKGVGTEDANAVLDTFHSGQISNGQRAIGHYFYLYGVGWSHPVDIGGVDEVCIGAKTSPDGLGGNAIPFLCTSVGYGQTRWTPGGQSNSGYPTAVANSDPDGWIFGGGMMNRR